MRKIYLGDSPEIEKKLGDDIAAVRKDDIFYPIIVVVPSNLVGIYLRRALVRCGGSYSNVRFLTMNDLAAGLAENNPGYILREAMPPFGEQWLAALTARKAAGGYFGPVADRPGFCEALLQTFQELENAGMEQVPSSQDSDPRRIAELQRLFEYYRELSCPFATREAAFLAAVQSGPRSSFMLVLYGIYQLSALEKKLLTVLARTCKTAVYWQKPAAGFASVQQVLHWLEQQDFTVERLPPLPKKDSNLTLLQNNLFQSSPDSPVSTSGDQSLHFICAPDEIGEVEEITREIIDLARGGMRFGEMAVLLPGTTYAGLFQERFAAAGIPCYLAGGFPLARSRTGRSFLLLLKMIGSNYPRWKVIELLTYAPLDYRRILKSSETPANPVLWDYLTMEAGVIKGRRQWREALERYCLRLQGQGRKYSGENSGMAEIKSREYRLQVQLLLDLLRIFFRKIDRLSAARSWRELTAAAGEFTERFFLPGDEREILLQLLKRLQRLDGCGGEFTLEPALELLQSALQATALPGGKFQQEGVNLLPLSGAAGSRFPVIFIPGLAEKIIPAPVKPDPLLPETERLALSGELLPRRHELDLEALRFTLALGGAERKAVLTWPRVSAAGSREQLPSFFLSRCGEALCPVRPGHDQLSRLPGYRYIAAPSERETMAFPVTAAEYDFNCCGGLPPSLQRRYFHLLSPSLAEVLTADLARFHHRWSSHDGIFTGDAPRRLLSARLERAVFSATALEDYARCPYSYFLKRLLGLSPLEEPEELLSLTPLARGRLLHKILEEFYRSASREGLLPVKLHPDRCRSLLDRICREQFAAVPPEERPPYSLLWQLQQRVLEETVQAFLEWEIEAAGDFIPADFEVSFGFSGSAGGPVALELPSGDTAYFRGRIDRIDRCGGLIRVIDYKTGRRRNRDESFSGGEALQLPVYLLAAGRIRGAFESGTPEARAYHLSPEGVKTVLFSGDSWPQKEAVLQDVVGIICEGIAAGLFFPYPNQGCRYCDYASICGPDIEKTFQNKASDPVLASFARLKEKYT